MWHASTLAVESRGRLLQCAEQKKDVGTRSYSAAHGCLISLASRVVCFAPPSLLPLLLLQPCDAHRLRDARCKPRMPSARAVSSRWLRFARQLSHEQQQLGRRRWRRSTCLPRAVPLQYASTFPGGLGDGVHGAVRLLVFVDACLSTDLAACQKERDPSRLARPVRSPDDNRVDGAFSVSGRPAQALRVHRSRSLVSDLNDRGGE